MNVEYEIQKFATLPAESRQQPPWGEPELGLVFDRQASLAEAEWIKFRHRILEAPGFSELSGGPGWDLQRLEKACHIAWELSLSDAEDMRRKLRELNTSSLRQQHVLNEQLAGKDRDNDVLRIDPEALINFYEPFKYLDSSTRELIMAILVDKVQQLVDGNANPRLLKQLARAGAGAEKSVIDKAEARAVEAERRQALLQEQLDSMQNQIELLHDQLAAKDREIQEGLARERALQEQLDALQEQFDKAQQQIEHLQKEVARLQRKLDELMERMEGLTRELEQVKAELERVSKELEAALKRIEELEARCRELQNQINELETKLKEAHAKIQKLEEELQAMERRAKAAEELAAAQEARAIAAEEEVARFKKLLEALENRVSSGCQTDLQGTDIDDNVRVKGMLEEMRLKVKALATELYMHYPAKELQEMLERSGLQELIKASSCFERLFDDAMERVVRLERMQEDHMEKVEQSDKFVTRTELVHAIERSTLEKEVRELERQRQQQQQQRPMGNWLPPLQIPKPTALPWGFAGFHPAGEVRRPGARDEQSLPALATGTQHKRISSNKAPHSARLEDYQLLSHRRVVGVT